MKELYNQIAESYALKSLTIVAGFLSVPLLISLVGKSTYGEWVIILSIMNWVAISDVGLNSSIRNFVTKFESNVSELKKCINFAFTFSVSICTCLLIAAYLILYILDFNNKEELALALTISLFIFPFTLLEGVAHGKKRSIYPQRSQLIGISITLLFYCLLYLLNGKVSLIGLVCIYSLGLLAILFSNIYFYIYKLKLELPKVNFNFKTLARPVGFVNQSLDFFVISISLLVVMNTDYLIVYYLFTPEDVTDYFSYEKIFSIYNTVITIALIPTWSFIASAANNGDLKWLTKLINKGIGLLLLSYFSLPILSFYSADLLQLWTGLEFVDENSKGVVFAVGAGVLAWNACVTTVANGLGLIRSQAVCYLVAAILNLPLSYFFAINMGYGWMGVKCATIISLFFTSLYIPIALYHYLKEHRNEAY